MVRHPEQDALAVIQQTVKSVVEKDRNNVQALIIEELRRIHEGVLARYGLRLSEYKAWKFGQQ